MYVPPGARDGRVLTGGTTRSEENTCRVTNLPEECDEQVSAPIFFLLLLTVARQSFLQCIFTGFSKSSSF